MARDEVDVQVGNAVAEEQVVHLARRIAAWASPETVEAWPTVS